MAKQGFHSKGFISLLTFGSFIIMSVTGTVLYTAPHGRIAYWVIWKFWGMEKTQWEAIHIVSCFFFIVVGVYHLINNWNHLRSYLVGKIGSGLKMKKELIISALIMVAIILGPMYRLAPFSYVLELSDYLKKSWIISKEYEPPFGHAEEVSLRVLTKKISIDLGKALEELKARGIQADPGDSLQKIAKANQTTPMLLFHTIKKFEVAIPTEVKSPSLTSDLVDEKFAGTGVGHKTLAEIVRQTGVDPAKVKERLAKNKVEMKDDETFHDAAGKRKVTPMEVLKVILVENYDLK